MEYMLVGPGITMGRLSRKWPIIYLSTSYRESICSTMFWLSSSGLTILKTKVEGIASPCTDISFKILVAWFMKIGALEAVRRRIER